MFVAIEALEILPHVLYRLSMLITIYLSEGIKYELQLFATIENLAVFA